LETKELLKKVRKIEIKTKGLSNQIFSGAYHSAFKGRGMTFSEVREYVHGDDIRSIDWNVTARFGVPHVKVFEEERELTVMLLVDISGSQFFGSGDQLKRELIAEICAVISFSAIQNNDKIGALFFSDKTELFIPPSKGKKHILRIIRELIEFEPESKQTNVSEALRHYSKAIKKKSIGFVISDFKNREPHTFDKALKVANKRHDLIAIQILDKLEMELPNIGLVPFSDAETGKIKWLNTSSSSTRKLFAKKALEDTKELYLKSLMDLFKHR